MPLGAMMWTVGYLMVMALAPPLTYLNAKQQTPLINQIGSNWESMKC